MRRHSRGSARDHPSPFADLNPRQVRWLNRAADQMRFPAGTQIDVVGLHVSFVYVVLDGVVACVPETRSSDSRRIHRIRAITDAHVLIIDRRYLGTLDRLMPGFSARVSACGTVGATYLDEGRDGGSAS